MKSPEQIDKIEAVVLYILQQFKEGVDYIKLFKIMYFAQREYLAQNGICIVEDTFKARLKGPVPALTYKVMKLAENGVDVNDDKRDLEHFLSSIEVGKNQIVHAIGVPDMDYIPDMEKEELDKIIRECRDIDSETLSKQSHDEAYNKVVRQMDDDPQKDVLTTIDIARAGGASKAMIDHIRDVQLIRAAFDAD